MKKRFSAASLCAAMLSAALFSAHLPAQAAEAGKIIIWVNGDKAWKAIHKIGQRYTAQTGIPVQVEKPEDAPGRFIQSAGKQDAPDIFLWAHDRLGEWVQKGLLSPLSPERQVRRSIHPLGWSAFTVRGRTWAYPISMESIGLIVNRDLLSKIPADFAELPALDRSLQARGKKAINWDYNNVYFTWPLLAAHGGYAFGHWDDGHYDADNTGVANRGALKGMETVNSLLEAGVLPKTSSYAQMEKEFHEGKTAMMINGPWAWEGVRRAKINFTVAPLPAVQGKPAPAFVGVQGAMISATSPNRASAVRFIEEYLLSLQGLREMNADVPLGVPANHAFYQELKSDAAIAATMHNIQQGQIMPNNPEMGKFWSAMKSALENITSGRQNSRDALEAAARQITEQSKQSKSKK
ncbi:maltose/maltodextrin ABC transporter substrate-binding protein MalE [Massilia sp. W12]|uniref:maltose/maltodextrin ABC transporter substrate-binding protein MalE n=1 Tax=Massilia sp. W12 TaxID=3126507 RepID=UPI0030CE37F6